MVEEAAQSPEFDAMRVKINDAAGRLFARPCKELDQWAAGERLRMNDFGVSAQAAEIVVASMIFGVVGQLVPQQREQAAVLFLQHVADFVGLALEHNVPLHTQEGGHG